MTGIRIRVTDLETGESEVRDIRDDYCLITDGKVYLDGVVQHANGTTILTLKKEAGA